MRLRLARSALVLAVGLAALSPVGCAKPAGPANKSPEEIRDKEIRMLERMRDDDIERYKQQGKSAEFIDAERAKYQDSIDKLKNPPPIPPADLPPAEPTKKDS